MLILHSLFVVWYSIKNKSVWSVVWSWYSRKTEHSYESSGFVWKIEWRCSGCVFLLKWDALAEVQIEHFTYKQEV